MESENQKACTLADLLECRFLNRDGAGVIIERLGQDNLVGLHRWFVHEKGGRSGTLFLEKAPLLDTLIEVQAELPPFYFKLNGDNSDEPGLPGIEEGVPGRKHRGVDPGSPQMRAYGFFGVGLMWGVDFLEHVVGAASSPFPLTEDLGGFISHVSSRDADLLMGDPGEVAQEQVMSPSWLTLALLGSLPNLDLMLRSAYRLARRAGGGAWESGGDEPRFRFLFFLGLIASGLRLPVSLPETSTGEDLL